MIRGMTQAAPHLFKATMAALDLSLEGGAPEWVHLLPTAKGPVQTKDNRGPYLVEDAQAVIAASFAEEAKLQIDENHAEDLRSGKGESSPAHGWIVALEARADGIWGKVDWNPSGRAMMENRSYRAMSPVILHDKAKRVVAILRASLVNRPNLKGLVSLNQESSMDAMAKMAAALGLAEGASEEDILSAIDALKKKKPEGDTAMQSALSTIGVALGLQADASPDAMAAAAQALQAAKAENVALNARVDTLEKTQKRSAAEAFLAAQIADKRAIPADKHEGLITLHMRDASEAEAVAKLYPNVGQTHTQTTPPADKDGTVSLNAAQLEVAAHLGITPEDYLKTLKEEAR
jgi:phage I-like protein